MGSAMRSSRRAAVDEDLRAGGLETQPDRAPPPAWGKRTRQRCGRRRR
ncbi:hypothetical protein QJS66_01915 [Kocuria rhizophila]|nr:hypothetical protein QJS66_01915 [Kocuria rhizophila]